MAATNKECNSIAMKLDSLSRANFMSYEE